jgi:hypothetical protein
MKGLAKAGHQVIFKSQQEIKDITLIYGFAGDYA